MRSLTRGTLIAACVLLLPGASQAQLGKIRNPFNNKPIGEQIGDGSKGIQIFPQREESTSQIAVISPPSIDPDTGAIYGGTTSGGGRGNLVPGRTAQLSRRSDGRWWWSSDYRDRYTGSPSPVPASNRIQDLKRRQEQQQLAQQRERERQQQLAQQRERERQQQQLAQQREWERQRQIAQQREWERQRQIAQQRDWERQREIAQEQEWERQRQADAQRREAFNLERNQEEQRRRQEAWEQERQRDLQPPPPTFPPPGPSGGAGEIYAEKLGIAYQQVRYADGTFGARLTRDATPNSPAATLGLEAGDTIFALDGLRFRTPDDVTNHYAQTSVDFINVRTNAPQSGSFLLP